MSAAGFDLLHPALQHHIVNTVGWRSLRPLQESAVEPIAAGHHVLLLAPTAGGKTEAATFPLLSRALTEDWKGLSILYLCPLRALLNNLAPRIEAYGAMVGRRAALWHGDTGDGERRRILAEPPDILLTTPESLEAMLISRRVDQERAFARLRAVVIDEAHAFAAADRGWHLLAVLSRLERIAGRELQRVCLSATVGNPGELIEWMCGPTPTPIEVVNPPTQGAPRPLITLDAVTGTDQAVTVIDRLHRGEKRLVFTNARAQAEEVAGRLHALGTDAYVSHSSLGPAERRRAEMAFAAARDCVIVATSTLELGVDIGDLDRVIQIGMPVSVNSMLQRIGRTGRRPGTHSNLLALPLDDDDLLWTLGVLQRWSQGRLDPVKPPPRPIHILLQQTLALVLQEHGITRTSLRDRLIGHGVFDLATSASLDPLVDHLVTIGVLFDDGGLLSMGRTAEETVGRRNFIELTSVFLSPQLLSVRHGSHEVGGIEPDLLSMRPVGADHGGPTLLSLAGRTWRIIAIDWKRRIVEVEPAQGRGLAKWGGPQGFMSVDVARGIRSVLAGEVPSGVELSKRARSAVERLRSESPWAVDGHTTLVRTPRSLRWYTYAGPAVNRLLAARLSELRVDDQRIGDLWIELDRSSSSEDVSAMVASIAEDVDALLDQIRPEPRAVAGVKFGRWLPDRLAAELIKARHDVRQDAAVTLNEPLDSFVYEPRD